MRMQKPRVNLEMFKNYWIIEKVGGKSYEVHLKESEVMSCIYRIHVRHVQNRTVKVNKQFEALSLVNLFTDIP